MKRYTSKKFKKEISNAAKMVKQIYDGLGEDFVGEWNDLKEIKSFIEREVDNLLDMFYTTAKYSIGNNLTYTQCGYIKVTAYKIYSIDNKKEDLCLSIDFALEETYACLQ